MKSQMLGFLLTMVLRLFAVDEVESLGLNNTVNKGASESSPVTVRQNIGTEMEHPHKISLAWAWLSGCPFSSQCLS